MDRDIRKVTVTQGDAGSRLDKYLALRLPEFSRSRIQQLIASACVKAGNITITDAARKVKAGESFEIRELLAKSSEIAAVAQDLDILFEDKDLLVINKPAGMTVHPAPGHYEDTLVNALLAHCGDSLSGIGGVMRPGIVHRIDKDTSGLLVVAKNDTAHRHLSAQLADRTLKRQYLAVVKGTPKPPSGKIQGNIGRSAVNRKKMAVLKSAGKPAVTYYKTEKVFRDASLVRCTLETGRTHQIRVHMSHIGHPLVGDTVYGRKGKNITFSRQALHATEIAFIHPVTENRMEFTCPLPEDMEALLKTLNYP